MKFSWPLFYFCWRKACHWSRCPQMTMLEGFTEPHSWYVWSQCCGLDPASDLLILNNRSRLWPSLSSLYFSFLFESSFDFVAKKKKHSSRRYMSLFWAHMFMRCYGFTCGILRVSLFKWSDSHPFFSQRNGRQIISPCYRDFINLTLHIWPWCTARFSPSNPIFLFFCRILVRRFRNMMIFLLVVFAITMIA